MSKDDDFDGPVFTNCKAEGNRGDGFFFGKGAKAKLDNCEANDNGGGGFVTEGEYEDKKQEPRLSKLAATIKKPRANNNEGWKIMIVGAVLAFLLTVAGMALYDFCVKPTLSKTLRTQLQTAEVKEIK